MLRGIQEQQKTDYPFFKVYCNFEKNLMQYAFFVAKD